MTDPEKTALDRSLDCERNDSHLKKNPFHTSQMRLDMGKGSFLRLFNEHIKLFKLALRDSGPLK